MGKEENFVAGVRYESLGDGVLKITYWDPQYDDSQHGVIILVNFNLSDLAMERMGNIVINLHKNWADVMKDIMDKIQTGQLHLGIRQ